LIGWHLHIFLVFPILIEVDYVREVIFEELHFHGLSICLRRQEAGEHYILPHRDPDELLWPIYMYLFNIPIFRMKNYASVTLSCR
jgi:hypothetical protein